MSGLHLLFLSPYGTDSVLSFFIESRCIFLLLFPDVTMTYDISYGLYHLGFHLCMDSEQFT